MADMFRTKLYGIVREWEYVENQFDKLPNTKFYVAVTDSSGMHGLDSNDLPRQYIAYAKAARSSELQGLRDALREGNSIRYHFTEPSKDDNGNWTTSGEEKPWPVMILPMGIEEVGPIWQLCLLLIRPRDSTFVPHTTASLMSSDENYTTNIAWFSATPQSQIEKGMVNCLSQLYQASRPSFLASIRNFLRGLEFEAPKDWENPLGTEAAQKDLKEFIQGLPQDKIHAFEYLSELKSPVASIVGPPGVGKTYLAVRVINFCHQQGLKLLVLAPSNSATNGITRKYHKEYEASKIVRVWGESIEYNDMSKHATKPETDSSKEGPTGVSEEDSADVNKAFQIKWMAEKATHKKGDVSKHALWLRTLIDAGVNSDNFSKIQPSVAAKLDPNLHNDELVKLYGEICEPDCEEETMDRFDNLFAQSKKATLRSCDVVFTTVTSAIHKDIHEEVDFDVILVDEASFAREDEIIAAIVRQCGNDRKLKLIILIGDPRQLRPVVLSWKVKVDDKLINPFADQASTSIQERLAAAGYRTFLLREQRRATEGLAKLYSTLSYKGALSDAPGTELETRGFSKDFLKFCKAEYEMNPDQLVPTITLSPHNGVCETMPGMSRRNLLNVALCLDFLEKMFQWGCSIKLEEITICTPYRQQALEYRRALNKAKARRDDWHGFDASQIRVATVNIMQGEESKLVVYDVVVSALRRGKIGFPADSNRHNVAISRAQEAFIYIADPRATMNENVLPVKSENASAQDGQDEEDEAAEEDTNKTWAERNHMRDTHDLYREWQYRLVERNADEMNKCVDTKIVAGQRAEYLELSTCQNCQKIGHKAKFCDQARPVKTCNVCGSSEHLKAGCPEKEKRALCRECNQHGHQRAQCPNRVCKRCKETGHIANECPQPDTRAPMVCHRCKQSGHSIKHCQEAPVLQCNNCGESGHGYKECPEPKRPYCSKCKSNEHSRKDCNVKLLGSNKYPIVELDREGEEITEGNEATEQERDSWGKNTDDWPAQDDGTRVVSKDEPAMEDAATNDMRSGLTQKDDLSKETTVINDMSGWLTQEDKTEAP